MDMKIIDRFILQTALVQLNKDLEKQKIKLEKVSVKVLNASFTKQSQRRRAMDRVALNCECEQKDRIEQYISRATELIANTYNDTDD